MSNVAIVGNGNVGHHFSKKLSQSHRVSVFSRNQADGTLPIDTLDPSKFDFVILTVPDDAIVETSNNIPKSDCIVVHTSGSRPLTDLSKHSKSGVVYPLQTFSKKKEIEFNSFPVFLEGQDDVMEALLAFVKSFSPDVRVANSATRAKIHLAAVFACNFANHMYAISDSILSPIGMSFSDLRHLAQETLDKAVAVSPSRAQTGPAIRNDLETMSRHLEMIDSEELERIYELLSKDIRKDQP